MKTYTVVATYVDDESRFCDSYRANSPQHAEELAQAAAEDCGASLLIAGVFLGELEAVA